MVLQYILISMLIVISVAQITPYRIPLYQFPGIYKPPVPVEQSACTCGQLPGLSNRIVNGWATSGPDHPFLALLLKDGDLRCGGSIINNLYVMTAAHCLKPKIPLSSLTVILGVHDRREIPFLEEFTYKVVQRIIHPQYGNHLGGIDNDIGLVKLDRPIVFNNFVQPICLPQYGTSGVRSAWVQGWGLDSENGSLTNLPMEAKLNILSGRECLQTPSSGILGTPDLHICAFHEQSDSCQGDSGGPLFYHQGRITIQIGLVSEGVGCATPGYPGIYTRVEMYLGWIYFHTADAALCTPDYDWLN